MGGHLIMHSFSTLCKNSSVNREWVLGAWWAFNTYSTILTYICTVTGILVLKFWSPGPKFSVEKWSPWDPFIFGKNGSSLEIWSESCKLERQSVVYLIHVRKPFPCVLLLHFHTSLFPSGVFLWLVGRFSPRTVLGASVSAPIKAHHQFVSRKTSYLRWLFFLSSNISRFPDATNYLRRWTVSFTNKNHDQTL